MRSNRFTPLLMWLLPLSFFAYQFILRLWPSLMMQQIMIKFNFNATDFGFLAAIYYYGYAGMQIPIAILLDKYGSRIVIFSCATICGIATLLFIYTDNQYLAFLSRFLIGAGSAVGFLGVSKVISVWFPAENYTKMVGYSFTIGLLGAIYGGRPVSGLVEKYGWEIIALLIGVTSLLIGILVLLLYKDRPDRALFLRVLLPEAGNQLPSDNNSLGNNFLDNTSLQRDHELVNIQEEKSNFKSADFKKLLSSPLIWLLGIANLLMVGSLEGFADIWGVNYLMSAYSFSKNDAASLISFIFIGMLFGGPCLALLSKYIGNYSVLFFCGLSMALIFLQLLLGKKLSWYYLMILFFSLGIMCCYQVILFTVGNSLVSNKLVGVTVAFLNSINMLGGSFFHSTIGILMDFFASRTQEHQTLAPGMGSSGYQVAVYNQALMIIPLCSITGAIIIFFISLRLKKYGKQDQIG